MRCLRGNQRHFPRRPRVWNLHAGWRVCDRRIPRHARIIKRRRLHSSERPGEGEQRDKGDNDGANHARHDTRPTHKREMLLLVCGADMKQQRQKLSHDHIHTSQPKQRCRCEQVFIVGIDFREPVFRCCGEMERIRSAEIRGGRSRGERSFHAVDNRVGEWE